MEDSFGQPFPINDSVWEHRNGNQYRVLFLTNVETERQDEYPTTVVYMNINNGKLYSRPLSRWTEKSFKLVSL